MAKKKLNSKVNRSLSWARAHKFKTLSLVILVVVAGVFSYNKYLDYRNVQDMKQLLADFQQLEKDVEAETGEEIYIEANCGSVGKFATSYACSIDLLPKSKQASEAYKAYLENVSVDNSSRCGLYSIIGYKIDDSSLDFFGCSPSIVRNANRDKSEEIFYQYDTSPGMSY